MNEEMNFQIGISGDGLSDEATAQAVENIKQADIEKGLTITEEPEPLPEEVIPEEAKAVDPEIVEEPKEKSTAQLYAEDTLIGLL